MLSPAHYRAGGVKLGKNRAIHRWTRDGHHLLLICAGSLETSRWSLRRSDRTLLGACSELVSESANTKRPTPDVWGSAHWPRSTLPSCGYSGLVRERLESMGLAKVSTGITARTGDAHTIRPAPSCLILGFW